MTDCSHVPYPLGVYNEMTADHLWLWSGECIGKDILKISPRLHSPARAGLDCMHYSSQCFASRTGGNAIGYGS